MYLFRFQGCMLHTLQIVSNFKTRFKSINTTESSTSHEGNRKYGQIPMYPKCLILVNKCKLHKMSISVMHAVKSIFIQTVCISVPCTSLHFVLKNLGKQNKICESKENTTKALFSSPWKPKTFQDFPSHQILKHMHAALDIDENKN